MKIKKRFSKISKQHVTGEDYPSHLEYDPNDIDNP